MGTRLYAGILDRGLIDLASALTHLNAQPFATASKFFRQLAQPNRTPLIAASAYVDQCFEHPGRSVLYWTTYETRLRLNPQVRYWRSRERRSDAHFKFLTANIRQPKHTRHTPMPPPWF